ncbi:hypothetical protein [Streptomyces sp. LN785]|uniref:hypothetical protein n=1 Tax=Streptomyces sp. LN785 TaxID=3112983 RepID=UPI0037162F55
MTSKPQPKPKTRPATAAERLAARALGKEEPTEVDLPTRSSAALHAERLGISAPERRVPKGMDTGEFHLQRYRARSGQQQEGDSPDVA